MADSNLSTVASQTPESRTEGDGAESLGQRIAKLMAERGVSQTAFATKTGIDRSELNRIVNGKRRPKPHELAWIAGALSISVDDLLGGTKLPVEVRRSVTQFEEVARRVLAAESERDAARAQLKAAEEQAAADRALWARERMELDERVAAARRDADLRIQEVQRQAAEREQVLRREKESVRAELDRQRLLAQQLGARNEALAGHLAGVQTELASERGKKVAAGLLAGLAGVFVGGVLGAAASSDDDDC
jgi:transcriptional regulator with XRE-family HTH domain